MAKYHVPITRKVTTLTVYEVDAPNGNSAAMAVGLILARDDGEIPFHVSTLSDSMSVGPPTKAGSADRYVQGPDDNQDGKQDDDGEGNDADGAHVTPGSLPLKG